MSWVGPDEETVKYWLRRGCLFALICMGFVAGSCTGAIVANWLK